MIGRKRLVTCVALGTMVAGVLSSVQAPVTQAQPAQRLSHAARTYTFARLGLTLRYPSAWTLKSNIKTADVLAKATRVVQLDPTTTVVYAPDGVAFIEIVTREGAVSARQFEQAVVAVFTDGAATQGKIAYQDGHNMITINHHDYDRADAVLHDSHGNGTFAATMLATQIGTTSVFFIGATNLQKSSSAARMKERDGVLTSLTFG